ncbi:protein SCAF11 isoform X1 [Tachyglossus aculeatus]|uniref:protein SCAF11 isoform X1 n=1 Tax=Tachyglossus aculeatus TaxID=9261 RepID=UPI0018F605DE|nr:protein SCAF11 isoform X1 [Tachyglossus aculeatus]XP_038615276.1 protein SCAF11 isoform X1 [Tachyglossus aculeatus]XP_038615283.1 protein SCAF11 isoform X1 [Tachyglossus aculeatus]
MKGRNMHSSSEGDQGHGDMEDEENRESTQATVGLYNEADTCPICLSCLLGKEVGFPENCNHFFCMSCILKWAETLSSCPVDRKPFQVIYKLTAPEGCIKIHVKRQPRATEDKKNESSFRKECYNVNTTSCVRQEANVRKEPLIARFYKDLKNKHKNPSDQKIEKKKSAGVKINKPRRRNCSNHCFRNYVSSIFSSNSHTGESFCTYRNNCKEFTEINEISAMIRQKRQELELSWSSDTLPGLTRAGVMPSNAEAEILPLASTVLPGAIFSTNIASLEHFESCCKGYTLAHTHGGEEKKQASGTSNSRGTRRKPAAAPARRSTRNTKAETVTQSQSSPVSSNSGGDAPDSNNSSINLFSSADSEKPTKQVPKRKPKRRSRRAPLMRKRLRSSASLPEKSSSSESAEEGTTESDGASALEKEQQVDVESSDSGLKPLTDAEEESANGLEPGAGEECTGNSGLEQEAVETTYPESGPLQSPEPVEEEEEAEEAENENPEESASIDLESDPSPSIPEEAEEPVGNPQVKTPEPVESVMKGDEAVDGPEDDLPECARFEAEELPPVRNATSEELDHPDSPEEAAQTAEHARIDTVEHEAPVMEEEKLRESPEADSLEDSIVALDQPTENSQEELPGPSESAESDCSEEIERAVASDGPSQEDFKSDQDPEEDLPKDDFPVDAFTPSLEENRSPLPEEVRSMELPSTEDERSNEQFNEDNNEMIPMECDSFCSDQNESEIEQPLSIVASHEEPNSLQDSSEKIPPLSVTTGGKPEATPQEAESSEDGKEKAKKPRTRRSRFHSPSTTWSPNKDTVPERKKSPSPSPKREIVKESQRSHSQSPKKDPPRGRRRSRSQSPKRENAKERRSSPPQSPKKVTVKESRRSQSSSPKKDTAKESRRSQSRTKDSSPREKSRSRSRDRENERDGQRRDRDRERRARRWSRSRSRSRSPSRSRTKSKSSSFSRNDRDGYSPRWKERWSSDSWRSPRGNDRYRKSDQEKQNENLKKEKNEVSVEPEDQGMMDKRRNDCPDWVMEKINATPDSRSRNPDRFKDPYWDDNRHDYSGNPWHKNFGSGWMPFRGRGHRGRGSFRGGFGFVEQNENRWQNRKPLSGNSNSSGNESSRFVEQQAYRRKSEPEFAFDTPADRSGWSSASSWAVRKTLPADVQNYYSRRGRNSSGPQSGWMRQEEETTEQDPNLKDQTNQQGDGSQLPINMMQQQMNVMQQQMNAQHQPMNIFPYPVGVHAPLMNIQRNPFNIHPQLPLHLHTGVPLMQVAAPTSVSQGLPPPPPPPPPSQQVNYIASQPEGKQLQGLPSAAPVGNNLSAAALPAPAAAVGTVGSVQGPSSGNASAASHSKASNAAVKLAESKVSVTVEASADSSKTDKKLQIQEKAAQEVKLAIKPFYQNKDITKEEYKEIVRKAVDKVCHSKSGEVNSAKVANLVKAYVDKYKHSRKGSQKKNPEEPVPAEK